MNSIVDAYYPLNFTDKERMKLSKLDELQIKLDKVQQKHRKRRDDADKMVVQYEREKRDCWTKARKLQDRLQKRCKHKGPTFHSEKYRDFGSNIIRTHCSLCHKIIHERSKDD